MTFKHEINPDFLVKIIFVLIVAVWSTSWVMIKFQIRNIDEGFSISYRFFCASLILFTIAKIYKFKLNFTRAQHRLIFFQGINLFFFNHLFFYSAINYLSSGIVATSAALSVIMIPIMDFVIHKTKFSIKILLGGILGIVGVILLTVSEFQNSSALNLAKGLFLCFLGVASFSCGSVIGKELKLNNIKTLISSTAYSMLYGSVLSFLVAFAIHKNVAFDFSLPYIASLLYLILFPGIFGYCAILFLVEKIGSSKAAYTALIYPVLALIISGFFENYQFTILTIFGIILVIIGNLIALKSRKKIKENVI